MNNIKRTKIVATLGPSTANREMIRNLIKAGVNVFRLNFSHGTRQSHAQLIELIKAERKSSNLPVAILQDLSGPKIRAGDINPPLELKNGDTLILDSSIKINDGKTIPVTYAELANDVCEGHSLLLADGNLEIKILKVAPPKVYCQVIVGGALSSHKGINYPDGSFSLSSLTPKDKEDMVFGLKHGVDYIALSFVKTAADIEAAKDICKSQNIFTPIIAKIEKHEAVTNILEILNVADGVMVARGDLGVETALETVPVIQKKIIRLANLFGKPVITATQMLLSMVDLPRPTRAEATDIANAILDGTDAIMLSDETAVGHYPIKAVETMNRIAQETEKIFPFYKRLLPGEEIPEHDVAVAISSNATYLAKSLEAKVILCPTNSGFTARMISRLRPKAALIAMTPSLETYYKLSLLWGVYPRYLPFDQQIGGLVENAIRLAREEKILNKTDRYVITAGYPFGKGKGTNLIKAGEIEE